MGCSGHLLVLSFHEERRKRGKYRFNFNSGRLKWRSTKALGLFELLVEEEIEDDEERLFEWKGNEEGGSALSLRYGDCT